MTPMPAARPTMTVEEFEEIENSAPETVRLEFINGKIEVKPVPDGNHDEIIAWLQRVCMQHRPDLWLYAERGLKVETYRKGRARPDGTLALHERFAGDAEWSEPDGVLMTVEVTSHDRGTDRRDRREKRDGYAAAGIPVHLLIDRDEGTITVYGEPEGGKYRNRASSSFGAVVALPDLVGFALETEKLKEFTD